MNAFESLHPVLRHHIVNTLGWRELRPHQEAAVGPVLAGEDILLHAPTAGGKTEAAVFPLLTAMAEQRWTGLSVLYVTPLRALLNNLEPRLAAYASWLGRRVGLWHGDVRPAARRRLADDPPEILLTTPESLEGMFVSTKVDHRRLFGGLRAVVVDELHAFAGDDRGWHLLAVLSRAARVAGRDLQRVGLSATVGNPGELLGWLQGGRRRPGRVVEGGSAVPDAEVQVDAVGSARNAARIIAALHRGEKRLVFCDSRRQAEEVASWLRAYEVETFVSHSSLSADERRRAEEAFAVGRDCVVVATSTLELGVDVGDLDRVIQLDAPYTVAGFLQRLGRTGRRAGTTRNCLFLATRQDALLRTLGLLLLCSRGFVEPIRPPPDPAHLIAQQVLALALQEGAVPAPQIAGWWDGLPDFGDAAAVRAAVEHLRSAGYLDADGGLVFVGPEAERRYGHRHFRELTSVLAADPEFVVLHGRSELGSVHPLSLVTRIEGARLLLLAGRSWRVEHIDWQRRRCHVAPVETGGRVRWQGEPRPLHPVLAQAMRDVVLGTDPSGVGGARLSRRGTDALGSLREEYARTVDPQRTVVLRDRDADLRWWTWVGAAANATLAAALDAVQPGLVDSAVRHHNLRLDLNPSATRERLAEAAAELAELPPAEWPAPQVTDQALRGLKFAETLPPGRAAQVLARRLTDADGAARAVADRVWIES